MQKPLEKTENPSNRVENANPSDCCQAPPILVHRAQAFTATGLICAFFFALGLVLFFYNLILGGCVMVAAFAVSCLARKKDGLLVCSNCGRTIRKLYVLR